MPRQIALRRKPPRPSLQLSGTLGRLRREPRCLRRSPLRPRRQPLLCCALDRHTRSRKNPPSLERLHCADRRLLPPFRARRSRPRFLPHPPPLRPPQKLLLLSGCQACPRSRLPCLEGTCGLLARLLHGSPSGMPPRRRLHLHGRRQLTPVLLRKAPQLHLNLRTRSRKGPGLHRHCR